MSWSPPSADDGPDENTVEDVCDHILQTVYDTELGALEAPSEAWTAVSNCLVELRHIVAIEHAPMSDSPGFQPSGSNSASGSGSLPSNGGSGRKRGYSQSANSGPSRNSFGGDGPPGASGNDDDEASGFGDAGRAKKPKIQPLYMSCPYRKRNPLRFNIRDHHSCASQGYNNMPNLK